MGSWRSLAGGPDPDIWHATISAGASGRGDPGKRERDAWHALVGAGGDDADPRGATARSDWRFVRHADRALDARHVAQSNGWR